MNKTSKTIPWKSVFSIKSVIYIILGVFCALVALKGFMIPNHFIDGGVTGLSIVLHEYLHINISFLLIVLNLPFLFICYRKMGSQVAIQSALAVGLLAILMNFIEIPAITHDKVLIAVFGGLLIGLGIGLVIKAGGVIDGLEIIAEFTNKRYGFSTSEIILATNSLLCLSAVFIFGVEPVMYSILTYFTSSKTTSYVVDGFEEYTALTIISKKDQEVKNIIVNDFNKAITVYNGQRGHLPGAYDIKYDCEIIMTVVTRLEIHQLKGAIMEMDPEAFLYVQRIKEVKGGIVKVVNKHH